MIYILVLWWCCPLFVSSSSVSPAAKPTSIPPIVWQVDGDTFDLGSSLVTYLRNTDIKTTLALQQANLRKNRYITKTYQRPSQYKDVSNIRGGLNIPANIKSAEIHYRVIKRLEVCTEESIRGNVQILYESIPLLVGDEIFSKAERRLSKRFKKFLKSRSHDINGTPMCDIEFKILHNRSIYAAIDPEFKEITEITKKHLKETLGDPGGPSTHPTVPSTAPSQPF